MPKRRCGRGPSGMACAMVVWVTSLRAAWASRAELWRWGGENAKPALCDINKLDGKKRLKLLESAIIVANYVGCADCLAGVNSC